MNRVERAYGDCKILLKTSPRQGLTDEYFLLVNSEDYPKIKDHNWSVAKIGGHLTATTYINHELVTVTKILFPGLKRIHRVNNDSLDNRRFNIKHFRNEKTIKITNKEPKQDTIHVKEKTKMIAVNQSNYEAIKKLTEDEGLKDHNSAISVLLESHEHHKELMRNDKTAYAEIEDHNKCSCNCNTSLWDKLKAKLRIA